MLRSNIFCAIIALIAAVSIYSAKAFGYLNSEEKFRSIKVMNTFIGDERLGDTYQ